MKIANIKTLFLAAFGLGILLTVSCKKEEITEQFARGGNAVIQTTTGDILVAGYNTSSSKSYEATLVLVNQLGVVSWAKTYGGSYYDAFFSVKNAHNGGFIATGFSNANSASSPKLLVVRTDASGEEQWLQSGYCSSAFSQGFCAITDADSGYLVAGYAQASNSDRDIYLLRINEEGEKIWDRKFVFTSSVSYDTINDEAYGVIAAPDSGYYLTGSMHGYSNCCGKIFLMKVSKTGDSLWTKTYNSGIGYSLTLTADGGIAIGGTAFDAASNDLIIIKTDLAGNKIWGKTFGGTGYEFGATMVATTDGGYAITGITESKGAGSQDVYLLKANASGDFSWDKTFGGSNADQGFGLTQMNDGGFCVTGISNSDGSSIFLNKTSSDGTEEWYTPIGQ